MLGQPPRDHEFVTTSDLETAAASTVEEAAVACEKLDELIVGELAGCFARVGPRWQARKYITGLLSDLPRKNRWTLAEQAGDATPDRMQRLVERAAWDVPEVMREVRTFAVRHLEAPLMRYWWSMSRGKRKAAGTPPG